MRNPGFVEDRTRTAKTHLFVKANHWNLSMEINLDGTLPRRRGDCAFQELLANAAAAIQWARARADA